MKEWSSPYNPFNSMKVLLWREHLEGCASNIYLPPITVDIDPSNRCNFDCVWCFPKGTKVLMEDLTTKEIQNIEMGDTVIGYKKDKQWKTCASKVLAKIKREVNETIIIKTDIGTIESTLDHLLWDPRGRWKKASSFKVGQKISAIGRLYESNISNDFMLGWLAGVSDGDGCFWFTKGRQQFRLAVKDKEILERYKEYAFNFGFKLYDGNCAANRFGDRNIPAIYLTKDKKVRMLHAILNSEDNFKNKDFTIGYLGGMFDSEGSLSNNILRISQKKCPKKISKIKRSLEFAGFIFRQEKTGFRITKQREILKFLMKTNPVVKRKKSKLIGHSNRNSARIIDIHVKNKKTAVYDIETETHDFIANGLRVHNCNAFDMMNSKAKTKDMSGPHMRRLAGFLAGWRDKNGNGPRSACIAGGGEPFMNPETPSLLEYMHTNELECGVITNGSILTDEVAKIMSKTCRWVGISMDSATKETFNKIKGLKPNSDIFYKILENIKKLTAYSEKTNCDIAYKYLIHPENATEIGEAAKLAKSLGCKDFHVRPVGWINLTKTDGSTIDLNSYSNSINKGMEQARNLEDDNFHVYGITHKFKPDLTPKKNFSKCRAIPLLPTFGADGWVHTCFDMRGNENLKLCRHDPDPSEIERFWGSRNHIDVVKSIDVEKCPRCTFSAYNEIIEKVIIDDKMCKFFP